MQRLGIFSLFVLALCASLLTARHAMAAANEALLTPGTSAPSFTLPSQEDKQVSLADYKGKWVVLYFYPKDMTSGCTMEAHNFQRDQAKFTADNAAILGVSLDTTASHKTFCTKENLTFKLLADPDGKVVSSYNVPIKNFAGTKFASRVTYLIAPDGKVAKVWPDVKVQNHSEEVLAAIEAEKKS